MVALERLNVLTLDAAGGFGVAGDCRANFRTISGKRINQSETVYKSPLDCLRHVLRGVGCSGHVRARTSHHSLLAVGRNLLCAEFRTILSLAPEQPVVRRIPQELSRRQRHSASGKNHCAYRVVAHSRIHRSVRRIGLVGPADHVGDRVRGHYLFGKNKDAQTRRKRTAGYG